MGQKSGPVKEPAEQLIKEIRRATRRQFSAEEKIRIVLSGLRGEDSIAELCRREGTRRMPQDVSRQFRVNRCCKLPLPADRGHKFTEWPGRKPSAPSMARLRTERVR